ncbi:MAG: class I SAM-dependent methyltransferase [Aquificota bacterium]|nr:class I SAM-dependent methyltransferase [Aquificota bacterium]
MSVFNLLSERYDAWYETPFGRSAYELECECVKRLLPAFKTGVEIGVGTGRFAVKLGVRFGVDPSENMILKAKERGVVAVLGRTESLPFRDSVFDLALMIVTLCFLDNPLIALKEARRVIEPRGKLVLGLITRESMWAEFYMKKAREGHPIYREARFYSLSEVRYMLEEAGFRIEAVLYTLIEEPQDRRPVKNREIKEGTDPLAGFTCIRAGPL